MIETVASKMAVHIKSVIPNHPASIAVLRHSLIIAINFMSVIGICLIAAFFTGKTKEVFSLLLFFGILRQLTGGLHIKSSMGCALLTSGVATALSFIELDQITTLTFTAISMVLIFFFAPSGIENQTRIPERYYPLLKYVSLVLVGTNLWFNSSIVAVAFLVQSLTLLLNEIKLKGGEKNEEKTV
ncbi:accessory regulator AgrB [Paenibacillus sp. FSL H7-0326]|uniref:accessory gene regulator ArgB-like protein n=1 Tax=Paenibacillus sp. FSL H7-0326 TaxID=1921144 RepID=UPI00096F7DE2|nr:accessory gene regulator B family protein [Paenibacillus sp. FSL H7-0326]OMC71075.1 accessory regulator AgrB [Paenibacillus sp. FSL H7-0326]